VRLGRARLALPVACALWRVQCAVGNEWAMPMRNGSLYHAIEYTVESSEDMSVDARPRTTSRSTGSSTTRSDGRYASDHASSKKIRLAIDTWKWQVLVERKKRSHGDVSRGAGVFGERGAAGQRWPVPTRRGTGAPCVYFCRAWSARWASVCVKGSSHGSSTNMRAPRPVLLPTHPGPTARHLRRSGSACRGSRGVRACADLNINTV
jgi:hypothetical protein